MNRTQELANGSIPGLLIKFSGPAIVGMMVNACYNVIDRIFVGNGVDPLAIAGISVSFPFMTIQMAFGMLIGIGSSALISIFLGQGKKEEAEKIASNALLLLIAVSAALMVFGLIFINPILRIGGASPQVLPFARSYMSIILCGAIFQAISFGMNNIIRADGSPFIAMGTQLIGAIMNAVFCPIFIFGLNMGIKGAALATVCAQAISATWALSYFFTGKSMLKIRRENLIPQWNILSKVLAIGSAPFAMQLVQSLLTTIMNRQLGLYGHDIAISVMGVINSLTMLILMPVFGINQGAQPIIGFNYGAKQYERVKHTLRLAIMAATVWVTLGFIITRLFPRQLIMLFNHSNEEFITFGVHALSIFLLMLPIIGFQVVSSNYFQATGKPKHAMFLSLSRQLLLLVPMLYILPGFFGLNGVLMAAPISDLGSSLLTGIWLYREMRSLRRRDAEVRLA